jgi:homoserine kinase
MQWRDGLVRVRVPATSANLGPGFDALGLALALYDDLEVAVTASGLDVQVVGEGAADVADTGEKHLVVRAMRATFDDLGTKQPAGLVLRCTNRIPHGRGLGSSAAAIVAGVLAARALAGAPAGPADALPMANNLEGHPDNVAPCLFGGLTIAWLGTSEKTGENDAVKVSGKAGGTEDRTLVARAVRLDPAAQIRPVVFIAPEPVSTSVARGLLPASVRHADAARNAGRAALLVAALTGTGTAAGDVTVAGTGTDLLSVLLDATEDRLHQDYRAPAMPATHDLVGRLRAAGIPAVVSGAGPSVLAFLTAGLTSGLTTGVAAGLTSGDAPSAGPDGGPAQAGGLAADIENSLDSIARGTGMPWRVSPLDVERRGASAVPGAPSAR